MALNRSQQFELIRHALELMKCSESLLQLQIYANTANGWEVLEIDRDAFAGTFSVCDETGTCIAVGSSIIIVEQLRSMTSAWPSSDADDIIAINLLGPPAGNSQDEWGFIQLYNGGERGSVPLPRNTRNNNRQGGFRLEPIRRRT